MIEDPWRAMLRRENRQQARAQRLQMFAVRVSLALIIGGIAVAIASVI